MTDRSAAAGDSLATPPSPRARRAAWASVAGATLEFYDFTVYGLAAALVFGKVFFPSVSPTVGLLSAFATFGVGFVMRPIGGAVFGHIGDRFGRKNALVATLLMMGISTVLIGCLPSFATIGFWAPAVLVVLRLIQGLAYGGEWGGAVLIASEHASPGRRSLYAALPNVGVSAGSLLGNLAFLLVGLLGTDAVQQWAWRLPFWSGAILVIVGIIVRLGVTESPEFTHAVKQSGRVRLPIIESFRRYPLQILMVAGAMGGLGSAAYINITYSVSFARGEGIASWLPLTAILLSNLLQVILIPVFGVLADRYGVGKVFVLGAVAWAALTPFLFPALGTGSTILIFLAYLIPYGIIGFNPPTAASPSLFAESFDARVRYSGLVGVQIGMCIAGFTPFVATLVNSAAGPVVVGLITSAALLISAGCGAVLARMRRTVQAAEQVAPASTPPLGTAGIG